MRIKFTVSGDPRVRKDSDGGVRILIPARMTVIPDESPRNFFPFFRSSRMLLYLEDKEQADQFQVGTRWQATGRFRVREGSHTGLFRSKGHFYPDKNALSSQGVGWVGGIQYALFKGRRALAQRIDAGVATGRGDHAILSALLLGDRSGLERTTMDRFARTGLVHIFAISGLHIGMLAGYLWFLLRWVGIPYRFRGWTVLPVLCLFVFYSGMKASSLRALIMLGCLWAAPFWYRKMNIYHAFSLAICIILALSPGQIGDVGFQYSFLLVAGLLALAPSLISSLSDVAAPDPWAPQNEFRLKIRKRVWSPIAATLVTSCVCVLLSSPLTAYHFHLFSPVGILGNLLAVPLVFCILLTGFPALVLSLFPFSWSDAVWAVPELFSGWLVSWTQWLESIPYGWLWVRAPELWMVLVGIGLFLCGWFFSGWKRPCILGALGVLLCYGAGEFRAYSRSWVQILPTERGQAFLLKQAFHPPVLLDAGSSWDSRGIAKAMKEQGINRIDAVFFSHPDRHHIGGWPDLHSMWEPDAFYAASGDVEALRSQTELSSIIGLAEGDLLEAGGWTVEVLSPLENQKASRADDRSLVLRFSRGFTSLMFLGGAGETVERSLLQRNTPLSTRLLLAGNPRTDDLLHADFLAEVEPEHVVFSGRGYQGISPQRREAEQRVGINKIPLIRSEDVDKPIVFLHDPFLGIKLTFSL